MSPWWTVLVLALHLVPADSSPDPFLVRMFSQNQVILEAQVQERVPGVFTLTSDLQPFPARLERSRLYAQVYTVFSPWDLVPGGENSEGENSEGENTEGENTEGEESDEPRYAAGPLSPVVVDLTSLLTQDSLKVPGRYTLSWELVSSVPESGSVDGPRPGATDQPASSTVDLHLILEETIMTLFSPNLGLIIQVNGI